MLPVNLDELSSEHIQSLIDSEIAESLRLEFKQQLPSSQSEEKREFLYDVASMANAAGGDVVFGIVERRSEENKPTGVAERLSGERFSNVQAEIMRLSSYINDGISPRLPGVEIRPIECADGDALVVRIPRSWDKPHMVTMGGVDRFMKRTGTTKNRMSVDEIRRAFTEKTELGQAIRDWRVDRTKRITKQAGPMPLDGEVILLFHVLPSSAFSQDILRESWAVSQEDKLRSYVAHGGASSRYNADGFVRFQPTGDGTNAFSYTQLFRSGIVEYADSHLYFPLQNAGPMILGLQIERHLVRSFEDAVQRFRRQGRSEPVYIGFSLTGIKDKPFYSNLMRAAIGQKWASVENTFISPEVFIDLNEVGDSPYSDVLLPLVNTMWQIAGLERTPHLSEGGWTPLHSKWDRI